MFAASAPDSYLPFTSCLLDQTHTILSTCPYLSGFLTALSAFLSFLGSPQSVLRAEYAFPAKPLSAWNGKQWFLQHLACTPETAAGTRLSVFLPVSCSFATGCFHNTSKWHKDSSVGNVFCSFSKVKSLALSPLHYIP